MSNNLYRDRATRLDTVVGSSGAYWALLGRLADQLNLDRQRRPGEAIDRDRFVEWCDTNHGFRPVYDDNGGISAAPDITDAQKYTLCLLKYGG